MKPQLSETVEDYLKAVYNLTAAGERAGTGQIAEELNVSPASVTDMVQRLSAEESPLLEYVKHQGVSLTERGRRAALEILRHHRLLELFLHDILGFSWDQVHAEADRLEHVISEQFEDRLADVLGDPERGLHGEPIPSRSLEMPREEDMFLTDLKVGQAGKIRSVEDEDPGFLRFLEQRGLMPGAEFEIVEISPYDDTLHLQLTDNQEKTILGAGATSRILVEIQTDLDPV